VRERKVLDDKEWAGWLRWMRNCFEQGTLKEHWRSIESEKWFDPAFRDFMNKDAMGLMLTGADLWIISPKH
jgi:hypothetical protein